MTTAFEHALLARRDRYNALFAEARHYQPQLDGAAFGLLLIDAVGPAVDAAVAVGGDPDALTEALFGLALDLYGHGLLGPERSNPWVAAGWKALPALARPLGRAPRRVAASISNALRNLGQTPGARPGEWLHGLQACAGITEDPDLILRAGEVLAWRAGMSHYRAGALEAASDLPAVLAARALGLSEGADVAGCLKHLHVDPWFDPAQPPAATGLRRVARIGGFRGFGGVFLAPPLVCAVDGELRARDGGPEGGVWRIAADTFGATFHRSAESDWRDSGLGDSDWRLVKGRVSKQGFADAAFPELEVVTSLAATRTTLAVTTPLSHAIVLIAACA